MLSTVRQLNAEAVGEVGLEFCFSVVSECSWIAVATHYPTQHLLPNSHSSPQLYQNIVYSCMHLQMQKQVTQ